MRLLFYDVDCSVLPFIETAIRAFAESLEQLKMVTKTWKVLVSCREVIRDELIPNAVSWYTGDAIAEDDDDEEEDDDDDEEVSNCHLHRSKYFPFAAWQP